MLRIHPAVIAQAAATSQVLLNGRFRLGVGSGEALNEHILGDRWPAADERLEMLEEAIEVIRKLLTGEQVSHRGRHYRSRTRVCTRCPTSRRRSSSRRFGPEATDLAARIGDGYCTTSPDADLIDAFLNGGGGGRARYGQLTVSLRGVGARGGAKRTSGGRMRASAGRSNQELALPSHFERRAR